MSTGPSILTMHDKIKEMALSHPSVKSFGTGERHLISNDGSTPPVHVWLEQPIISTLSMPEKGSKTRKFRIQLLVLDIPMEGNPDQLEVISRCDLIAIWIVLALSEVDGFFLGSDANALTLCDYHSDLWAGVRIEMEIETQMPINACDVREIEP